jgi:hypothetical protein
MFTRFAKHYITNVEEIPFCAAKYSRFKFGDGNIAINYGKELGESFVANRGEELLNSNDIVFVPSPYDSIPTASYALAQSFRNEVNKYLYKHEKKTLLQSKIHRYKTYTIDYGNLSFEERMNLISSDTYHIDADFLNNRTVLFIDDIRITGSHEMIIQRQVEREKLKGNFIFLYYAILDNNQVPPEFENFLNYYEVKNISHVSALFNSPGFEMNTRVIKYILKSDTNSVEQFISTALPYKMEQLVNYAVGNNYHLMEDYQINLNKIIKSINYGN